MEWLLFIAGLAVLRRSSSAPPAARQTVLQQLHGQTVQLELVHVGDGFYMTEPAASSYVAMRAAAAQQGVFFKLNSAWRSNAQQKVLRDKYEAWLAAGQPSPAVAIAAKVGESNHEAGKASDIDTEGGTNAAFAWLNGNASRWRFKRTVSSEPWHWEFV